ncbi:hypothetical protein L6164_007688 [Bauhinia variegata]|uniref:Uncharacterized protein n=1 Tax=Bauhinia variegata TaxID=167791 RepID=A0ACB9PEA9_BAUVA|nr:hypothetical protein L6164_007688 [Bauhinia variegata]
MSAPLVYSSRYSQTKLSSALPQEDFNFQSPIAAEKRKEGLTRDVGTQSTPPCLSSSSSLSPASTPPIKERSIKIDGDSPSSNTKTKSEEEEVEVRDKEREETKETEMEKEECMEKEEQVFRERQGGCFSWMRKKRQREKEKERKNNIFFTHFTGC